MADYAFWKMMRELENNPRLRHDASLGAKFLGLTDGPVDDVPYSNDDIRFAGQYARNAQVTANQDRMRKWAAPVKQQNKQMKNNFDFNRGSDFRESFMSPSELTNLYAGNGDPYFYDKSLSTGRKLERGRPNYTGQREIYVNRNDRATPPKNISISRLAGPIGALPMVAPEALGMIGAAQEAQRQGVNPMYNWLQRMTPVPVVAPTGNGGEVYNYQSGQRYTPEY